MLAYDLSNSVNTCTFSLPIIKVWDINYVKNRKPNKDGVSKQLLRILLQFVQISLRKIRLKNGKILN